jgi:hypothetical protein
LLLEGSLYNIPTEKLGTQWSQQGEAWQRERWEADYYKFGSDHTGILTVEEQFSLMTLQIYSCKNGRIFDMKKSLTIMRNISESQDHHNMGKKPLQEM